MQRQIHKWRPMMFKNVSWCFKCTSASKYIFGAHLPPLTNHHTAGSQPADIGVWLSFPVYSSFSTISQSDTLYSIGPIASPTELPSLKRGRMSEALLPCVSGPSYSGPRSLAGSQRVSSAIEEQQQSVAALADANFNYLFGLPIHSQDLGDLPVYESFEWDLPFGSDTTHSLGAGFSFDSAASLYGLNTDMPHMGGVFEFFVVIGC